MLRLAMQVLRAFTDWTPAGLERRMNIVAQLSHRLDQRRGLGYGWDTPAEEAQAIAPLITEADAIVFDVGAYHGEWTVALMRARRDRRLTIHAFDPSPTHCEMVTRAFETEAQPGLHRLVMNCAAVSDRAGRAVLYSDKPSSGLASLVQRDMAHAALTHTPVAETTTLTLDEYARERGIQRIDFVKMDIEGHELAALRGAEALLQNGAIRALAFEFGECNVDSRTFMRDFWQLLMPLGFAMYRILPGGRLLSIRRYDSGLEGVQRRELRRRSVVLAHFDSRVTAACVSLLPDAKW
jgi:FkbM family methyltransferase